MSQTFTPEQIKTLQENPYVQVVTRYRVYFTAEFKKRFWEEYQKDRMPGKILRGMGLDTDMLGRVRVQSISYHVRKEAASAEGIHERKTCSAKKNPNESDGAAVMQNNQLKDKSQVTMVTMLVHRIAFLEQQMDFLKKTISAGSGRKSQ